MTWVPKPGAVAIARYTGGFVLLVDMMGNENFPFVAATVCAMAA
jgi:hypothetical protein